MAKWAKREFTPEECEYIRENYQIKTVSRMSKELKCGWSVLNQKLREMGLEAHTRYEPWTEQDDLKLAELAKKFPPDKVAAKMNRSKDVVIRRARAGNILFKYEQRLWTPEDLDALRRGWGYKPLSGLAKELRRTECAVTTMAHKIGLGPVYASSDDIPLAQFCRDTGMSRERITKTWAIKYDFPLKSVKPGKRRIYHYVDNNKILKWLKNHQDLFDASKIPMFYFGQEPKWLKAKRIADRPKYGEPPTKPNEGKWSQEEIDRAVYMFNAGIDYDGIAKTLNRTRRAVRAKLNRMGVSWKLPQYWQGKDFRYLRDNYETKSDAEMAAELGRSELSVRQHRQEAGYSKRGPTKAERERREQFVRDNWQSMSDHAMAESLQISDSLVRKVRKELGLKRDGSNDQRRCTEADEQYVIDHWQLESDKELAEHIGRTKTTVSNIRKKHGLERPKKGE